MDINADLGEGAGNDEHIMPLISSCNIACGGHYGDKSSIQRTIELAQKHQVKVGAHWSYPDQQNFGRKQLNISTEKLTQSLREQLSLFLQVCEEEGIKMNHIKAHGALYTYGSNELAHVDAMIKVLNEQSFKPKIYLQENSLLHQEAKAYLPLAFEAFIDRRYVDVNTLLSRSSPQALIKDPQEAWEQFELLAFHQQIKDIKGDIRKIKADTFCIHGDHAASLDILKYIRKQLNKKHD
jgi:UPF0271 protein